MSCSRLSRRTSCHIRARLTGSRPVVGSSKNSTCGPCTNAAARSSRRRIPPEYLPIGRVIAAPISTSCARSATRRSMSLRDRPYNRPCNRSNSSPVCFGSNAASCSATPIRSRTAPGSVATSYPATTARPSVGVNSVHKIRTMVDLPAPFGPRNP